LTTWDFEEDYSSSLLESFKRNVINISQEQK